jgi:hypothetical protein
MAMAWTEWEYKYDHRQFQWDRFPHKILATIIQAQVITVKISVVSGPFVLLVLSDVRAAPTGLEGFAHFPLAILQTSNISSYPFKALSLEQITRLSAYQSMRMNKVLQMGRNIEKIGQLVPCSTWRLFVKGNPYVQ